MRSSKPKGRNVTLGSHPANEDKTLVASSTSDWLRNLLQPRLPSGESPDFDDDARHVVLLRRTAPEGVRRRENPLTNQVSGRATILQNRVGHPITLEEVVANCQ
jgi:hypothetical protein